MKLCACVCTYNRPHLLPRIIKCFEEQDYQDRFMVILDDGGQYGNKSGDGWRLISTHQRFQSLGTKRNHLASLVPQGTHAILPIDDDDLFMPWHFSAAAKALENAAWSRPSVVLTPGPVLGGAQTFCQNYTGRREDHRQERLYHPSWAIDMRLFTMAGGYPDDQSGPEDQGLMRRMEMLNPKTADQCELGFRPSYVYCWGNQNISGKLNRSDPLGKLAWESLRSDCKPAVLESWVPNFDPHSPVVHPYITPRPF